RSGFMASTCARDASSGTTPPKRRCTSIWLEMRLDRIRRPSSTTATAVSSQEVSIPRTSIPLPPDGTDPVRDLGDDVVEGPAVLRRVHVVRPHHQGVLAGLLVVALADADRAEPEPAVHP